VHHNQKPCVHSNQGHVKIKEQAHTFAKNEKFSTADHMFFNSIGNRACWTFEFCLELPNSWRRHKFCSLFANLCCAEDSDCLSNNIDKEHVWQKSNSFFCTPLSAMHCHVWLDGRVRRVPCWPQWEGMVKFGQNAKNTHDTCDTSKCVLHIALCTPNH